MRKEIDDKERYECVNDTEVGNLTRSLPMQVAPQKAANNNAIEGVVAHQSMCWTVTQ